MHSEHAAVGFIIVIAGFIEACSGTRAQVGFPNAPGVPAAVYQPRPEQGESRDAVANGRDSCRRQGSNQKDPIPQRLVPCDEEAEEETPAQHGAKQPKAPAKR